MDDDDLQEQHRTPTPSTAASATELEKRGHKVTGGAELHRNTEARSIPAGGGAAPRARSPRPPSRSAASTMVETDDLDDLLECCQILATLGDGIEVRPVRGPESRPAGRRVKRYVLLLAYEPGGWDDASEEVQQQLLRRAPRVRGVRRERGRRLGLRRAGRRRHGDDGPARRRRATVTDGPYVETVEIVGGYYDVELPDLDSAIEAARLLPPSYAVEIRPTVTIEGYEHA